MASGSEVVVQDVAGYGEDQRTRLQEWLARFVAAAAPDADSFGVRLATDEEVRSWNRRLRDVDAPTDVLSFPGESTAEGRHLGDVLVSLSTARSQAERLGHSLERELKELLIHGVLHCLGHDHQADDGEMNERELDLRERWIDHG